MHSTLSRLNWDPIAKVGIPCFFRHMTFFVSVPHPNLVPEVGKSQYVYFITNALSALLKEWSNGYSFEGVPRAGQI